VDDAVPDRVRLAERLTILCIDPGKDPSNGLIVVANGDRLAMRGATIDPKRARGLTTYPINETACQSAGLSCWNCGRRKLDDLEFQGGTSTVEHQHPHRAPPSFVFSTTTFTLSFSLVMKPSNYTYAISWGLQMP
jgi:hypothetical protein